MITTRKNRAGKKVYVIDRRFKNRATGIEERYRREPEANTKQLAEDEERRIIAFYLEHGTIVPLLQKRNISDPQPKATGKTWEDAVKRAREVTWPKLKHSTTVGYDELIDSGAFESWRASLLLSIGRDDIDKWDSKIAPVVGSSRRRNFHVVVRTVFRSAFSAGYLTRLPEFPPLPKVPRTVVEAADPVDVYALINESDRGVPEYLAKARRASRLAFALAAYAGLRASEVRALRWGDVDLRAGTITVRLAMVHGEIDSPKSGHQREIPIAPALLSILTVARVGKQSPDLVAPRADGEPWGDTGLLQAVRRAALRLGIEGRRFHSLRHHFVTVLFSAGTPAPVVQALAGHGSLSVTQRYAHHSREQRRAAVQVFS